MNLREIKFDIFGIKYKINLVKNNEEIFKYLENKVITTKNNYKISNKTLIIFKLFILKLYDNLK